MSRSLVYAFYDLSFVARYRVLNDLNLLETEDYELSRVERDQLAFTRARERGMIEDLRTRILAEQKTR